MVVAYVEIKVVPRVFVLFVMKALFCVENPKVRIKILYFVLRTFSVSILHLAIRKPPANACESGFLWH